MRADVESTGAGGACWEQPQQSTVAQQGRVNDSDNNDNNDNAGEDRSHSNCNSVPHQRPHAAAPDMSFADAQQQQQQASAASRQYPPQQFHQQSALSQASSPSPHHPLSQLQSQPHHPQQQQQQHHLQQQQPQQQPPHHQYPGVNGVNGANMGPSAPMPTPAGHQAELHYIYGMVEDLSKQLSDNRRVTEDIVTGLGRIRNRARSHTLSNEDLMVAAADDINGTCPFRLVEQDAWRPDLEPKADDQNLDALVSILSEALEKANHSRDANATLLSNYANAIALMLKQFHDYKAMHVADVAAWHRSYRTQLDEARRENCRLRDQIWEMHTHAGRANESLRRFRRSYDDDEARWARRVQDTAARQELRFWKRMAMPELDDDDPYWSADDDIIDDAEKTRQIELERVAAEEQLFDRPVADEFIVEDAQPPTLPHMAMMGGTAMQRDESGGRPAPVPPPRPLSAASSTGSTGQQ